MLKNALLKAKKVFYKVDDRNKNKNKAITGQFRDDNDIDKRKHFFVVPYVPTMEKWRRHLRKFNTELVFRYNNKLHNKLVNNKPNNNISKGVYKIPCKSCKKVYIGETGRDLKKRIKEHKGDIVSQKPSSAIAEHVRKEDHHFDFKKAKIIFHCNNFRRRRIVESSLIYAYSDLKLALNFNNGFSPHNIMLSKYIRDVCHLNNDFN